MQLRADAAASEARRLQTEQRLIDLQKALDRSQADVDELKAQRSELEQRFYGMLEMAAQERHQFLVATEQLGQLNQNLASLSDAAQAQLSPLSTLQLFAEQMPRELQQLESRLNEAGAADRQRIADQNEHWSLAWQPLAAVANQVDTLVRIARQRVRATHQASRSAPPTPRRMPRREG